MNSSRTIEVLPWSSEWAAGYRHEASRILNALPCKAVAIHHIGSTSVEGLAAKPVIDMLLVVEPDDIYSFSAAGLEALGYEDLGEYGIPGRRYFRRGDVQPTHHLHAYAQGSAQITRHLAFRDYLRAFPDQRQAYGQIKMEAADACENDIDMYMAKKGPWIREAESRALAWYTGQS